jgi:predicted SAM-dependent methyltransferase
VERCGSFSFLSKVLKRSLDQSIALKKYDPMTLLEIYQSLPESIKPASKAVYLFIKRCRNIATLSFLKNKKDINVHLGCGDERKPGYINIDIRTTVATDYSADLNRLRWLRSGTVRSFYSHAFFEHLYRLERIIHMENVYRLLQDDGFCCYIGLPYFPNIAKYYLERRTPGIVGDRFDLFNVYRYTHGDPEHAPTWWLAQLHKSLFDEEDLSGLLRQAGFSSHSIFIYCCIEEEGWFVSMGFYTRKGTHSIETLKTDAKSFLSHNCTNKVILDTVRFV